MVGGGWGEGRQRVGVGSLIDVVGLLFQLLLIVIAHRFPESVRAWVKVEF